MGGYPYFECKCCSDLVCYEDAEDDFVNVMVYINGKEQYGSICVECLTQYENQFVSTENESNEYSYRLIGKIPWYIQSIVEAPNDRENNDTK